MKIIWGIPVVLMFIAFIRAEEMLDNAVKTIMDMMEIDDEDNWETPEKIKLVNAEQSSTYDNGKPNARVASRAIDSSLTTASVTGDIWDSNPWWKVELERPSLVKNVELSLPAYPVKKGYYKGLKVQIGGGANGPWIDCASKIQVKAPATTYNVKCSTETAVKFLKISTTTAQPLYISEVRVVGIALGYFTEATADFSLMGASEVHPVAGQLLDDGNFIFSYSKGTSRFMILTSNDGVIIKGGQMSALSLKWKDTRQWNKGISEYTLKNFKGTERGEFRAFTAIHTSDGTKKMGELEFKYDANQQCMRIKGTISGLTPGLHGTHIHYYGDGHEGGCMATKGHYNPFKAAGKEYDLGDLGNISADVNGVANVNICNKVVHTIGQFSVIGRSVVVHIGPNGNAGKRVGCGVIAREFPRI